MNPFKILNIGADAAKPDIIRAAAAALREKTYSGKDIAIAQKILMNSVSKAVAQFIYFINVKPFQNSLNIERNSIEPIDGLEYLPFEQVD